MQQTTQPVPAPQSEESKTPTPPPEFQEGNIAQQNASALIRILKNTSSTEFQKAKACQRIGELGVKEAVPALAALLGNEHLSTYARYGLEPIADPSVDDALRASLATLKGNLLIGVINSIGKRRDTKAGAELAQLLTAGDPEIARAAAAALGRIGGDAAMKELQAALLKTNGLTRMAVADAALMCAERFLAEGKRDQALALYASLSAPDVPKPARLAAVSAMGGTARP